MAPTRLSGRDAEPPKLRRIPQLQGESNYRDWESALFFVLTFHGIKRYVPDGVEEEEGEDDDDDNEDEDEKGRVWRERMWEYSLVREYIDSRFVDRLECYGLKFGKDEEYDPKKLYDTIVKCIGPRAKQQQLATEKLVDEWLAKRC
ncbi:hypothetical protein B0T09DRAFT_388226 [Sordaria sp. MPI-SDFR-AT-0083]|nr:hypothetical protein B0T09DRAFT_388226 [Sordaria sp. MPI-SDFR-AT-0083]